MGQVDAHDAIGMLEELFGLYDGEILSTYMTQVEQSPERHRALLDLVFSTSLNLACYEKQIWCSPLRWRYILRSRRAHNLTRPYGWVHAE